MPGFGSLSLTCWPCWSRASEVELVIALALCEPPSLAAVLRWHWRRLLRAVRS